MQQGFADDLTQAPILVVDDERANVVLLERLLHQAGYPTVVTTQDSRQVLSLCREHQPHLVLLDLNMPHMTGFDVMEQLGTELGDDRPTILVLSAQSDRQSRLKALQSGARDFLTKPFDRAELLARIRNMLDIRKAYDVVRTQNQRLEQRVQERTEELRRSRLSIIRHLGRAAEYKDAETGLHIIRMSRYSELIGLGLNLDPGVCELLLNASPMHDIGKIGIADQILQKPDKLSPSEWEEMKQHPLIGASILAGDNTPLLTMAHDIALNHHERWDGSGYPNGLRDEEIPLVGRIVAIADVFDALSSRRPYKEAWRPEEARAYIRDQAGSQFEPRLVTIFLERFDQVLEIGRQYRDENVGDDRHVLLNTALNTLF